MLRVLDVGRYKVILAPLPTGSIHMNIVVRDRNGSENLVVVEQLVVRSRVVDVETRVCVERRVLVNSIVTTRPVCRDL